MESQLQHCGCDKARSTWKNPQPTRIGYCSWCWSAIDTDQVAK